jgi:hypothetical protein
VVEGHPDKPDTTTQLMNNVGTLVTLMRIFETQAHSLVAFRSRAIDFLITPDTSSYALADFYRSQEMAKVGDATANQIIPELQQRLSDFEQRLFKPNESATTVVSRKCFRFEGECVFANPLYVLSEFCWWQHVTRKAARLFES